MRYLVCILFITAAFPAHALTEYVTQHISPKRVDITLSPEHPQPFSDVQMELTSYALDLRNSTITWTIDGEIIDEGVGKTALTFRTKGVGSQHRVTAHVAAEDGIGQADARITPAVVDIVWEGATVIPPFYRGRALPSPGSDLHAHAVVQAMRNGTRIPENEIVYTWTDDSRTLLSGRGKSRITLPGGLTSSRTISVTVESGDFASSLTEPLPIATPRLALYEQHPLFGVLFHRAFIGDVHSREAVLKVTAAPFFAPGPHNDLAYAWNANGIDVSPNPAEPQTLTITAANFTGTMDIRASLTSISDYLLDTTGTWRIVFGQESPLFSGTSIFGD